MAAPDVTPTVPALRVKQWLPEWECVNFDPAQNQAKPAPHFYLFSLSAAQLRKLSAIYRRDASGMTARKEDLGIQRRHDPQRSSEIRRYVVEGYPRSGLSEAQRKDSTNDGLRKPGWLPTAVVVNILRVGDERNGNKIDAEHVVNVVDDPSETFAALTLPAEIDDVLPPIEVIDGQHRLFAFDEADSNLADFQLPVIAFHGLDISWQAYLFWTINIKPKKINASLAFDLYPLLREQDWLDSGDRVLVYRESRAQELAEVLWATPESPWYKRINMLGGPRKDSGPVTQAAFVRSLIASMVKPWAATGRQKVGGIFGGTPNQNDGLAWSRVQQGAFLVTAWKLLAEAVTRTDSEWARASREEKAQFDDFGDDDAAFSGNFSLLATDQGVRGFQHVVNDLAYIRQKPLGLADWRDPSETADVSAASITEAARTLPHAARTFLTGIADGLATYDWRTSSFPGLSENLRLTKAALRGSGGYKELRDQLIAHLKHAPNEDVARAAGELKDWL